MPGALDGLLVLELGMGFAIPYCTMLLGDLGARVIKIGEPESPRTTGNRGVVRIRDGQQEHVRIGTYRDRNKESILLDLKSKAGRAAFFELVKQADVLAENMSVGTMARLGLDYPVLKEVNPRLVFAEISTYGQTGPDAEQRGYDPLAQARGGFMSITGFPENPPTKAGQSLADYYGGLHCAVAILAALRYRDQTGKGQAVDISMLDSLLTCMDAVVDDYFLTGLVRTRSGNRHPGVSYAIHACSDGGYVVLALLSQAIWDRFCNVIGQPELREHPMLATAMARREYVDLVDSIAEEWMSQLPSDEVIRRCVEGGVPAAKVQTVDEVARDPQVAARNMFVTLEHQEYGPITITGTSFKLSETPGVVKSLAPDPGQHTADVLAELLGYNEEQIAEVLKSRSAAGVAAE